jgi:hypothetical protein
MAKATKAATPKAYMLTEAQLELLTKAHSSLDTASDTLNGIDGDENLYEIGKQVGDATSDIINAFNDLGDIIDSFISDDDNDFEFKEN